MIPGFVNRYEGDLRFCQQIVTLIPGFVERYDGDQRCCQQVMAVIPGFVKRPGQCNRHSSTVRHRPVPGRDKRNRGQKSNIVRRKLLSSTPRRSTLPYGYTA